MNEQYNTSFRCYYDSECGTHANTHYIPCFPVSDIPKWITAYQFTHPSCTSISVKVWFNSANAEE